MFVFVYFLFIDSSYSYRGDVLVVSTGPSRNLVMLPVRFQSRVLFSCHTHRNKCLGLALS